MASTKNEELVERSIPLDDSGKKSNFIRLSLNGTLVGEYKDPDPYICGMAGIRCDSESEVFFGDLEITPISL